jgi:hypothetical protein
MTKAQKINRDLLEVAATLADWALEHAPELSQIAFGEGSAKAIESFADDDAWDRLIESAWTPYMWEKLGVDAFSPDTPLDRALRTLVESLLIAHEQHAAR